MAVGFLKISSLKNVGVSENCLPRKLIHHHFPDSSGHVAGDVHPHVSDSPTAWNHPQADFLWRSWATFWDRSENPPVPWFSDAAAKLPGYGAGGKRWKKHRVTTIGDGLWTNWTMKFNSSTNSIAIMRLSRKAGDVAAHTQNHQHGPFLDGTDCFIGFPSKNPITIFLATHIDFYRMARGTSTISRWFSQGLHWVWAFPSHVWDHWRVDPMKNHRKKSPFLWLKSLKSPWNYHSCWC